MTALHTVCCAECPRMIVRAVGETGYPLCQTCVTSPGWVKDPLMRWLFAPRAEREPQARERRRFGIVAVLALLMWSGVIGWTLKAIFSA